MDWQIRLISTYVKVNELWEQGLSFYAERMSNNNSPTLTDPEILTIFLNGVMIGRSDLKGIYNFTADHLADWFPSLCGYEAFVRRLNQISDVFSVIVEILSAAKFPGNIEKARKLVDSIPITLAKSKRSSRAKVASEYADKGYCGSKDLFYYGVKLHVVGMARINSIPIIEFVGLTPASCHDLTAFRQVAPMLENCDVFADKAYADEEDNLRYRTNQNVQMAVPIRLRKGEKCLDAADQLYSTAVSRIRQPIESFFNWLQVKTGIQAASKVRSTKGLMVHVFGRLAAAMLLMLNF